MMDDSFEYMKMLVLAMFACLLVGCATPQGDMRLRDEDDILESVFCYQFSHNPSSLQQKAGAYYLSLGENAHDPSDLFMQRFAGYAPPVRKVSRSKFDPSVLRGRIVDTETGEQGLIFMVKSIKWFTATEVWVNGGYYQNGLASSGHTYTVQKKNGRWSVVKAKLRWIS